MMEYAARGDGRYGCQPMMEAMPPAAMGGMDQPMMEAMPPAAMGGMDAPMMEAMPPEAMGGMGGMGQCIWR